MIVMTLMKVLQYVENFISFILINDAFSNSRNSFSCIGFLTVNNVTFTDVTYAVMMLDFSWIKEQSLTGNHIKNFDSLDVMVVFMLFGRLFFSFFVILDRIYVLSCAEKGGWSSICSFLICHYWFLFNIISCVISFVSVFLSLLLLTLIANLTA